MQPIRSTKVGVHALPPIRPISDSSRAIAAKLRRSMFKGQGVPSILKLSFFRSNGMRKIKRDV